MSRLVISHDVITGEPYLILKASDAFFFEGFSPYQSAAMRHLDNGVSKDTLDALKDVAAEIFEWKGKNPSSYPHIESEPLPYHNASTDVLPLEFVADPTDAQRAELRAHMEGLRKGLTVHDL